MHRLIWTCVIRALRVVLLLSVGVGAIAAPSIAAGQTRDDAPLDLAALVLHSDDLIWLLQEMGLLVDDGYPYGMLRSTSHTTIDEAVAAETYGMARGGFTLARMGEDEAADFLEETGWIRSHDELLVLPELEIEDAWSLGVAVTLEEFATADGAEAAMRTFDDEEMMANLTVTPTVERLDLPPGYDDGLAAMWKVDTTRYSLDFGVTETVSLWVQVDTLVVSVALLHGPGYIAPDPDLLVALMELQLKRLEHAEHLYQPYLAACAPHLGGVQVADWRADYAVLNGQAFPNLNDTFDDLAADQEEVHAWGVVDAFGVSQSVSETAVGAYDGELWFAGRTRAFVDQDHAAQFLAATGTVLEDDGYTELEELTDVPDLGDGAVAYTYVATDGYAASIVYVQVEAQVFMLRLGSTIEAVPDAVVDLAEEYLARVTEGDCTAPLSVPRGL
jgi:hypothetical protein